VDIIRPDFPADKLIVIEVYNPGGNWSQLPPHKHDVHNPPAEVDLDEIYYYRINRPKEGFALQRLYSPDLARDVTLRAQDGDASWCDPVFIPSSRSRLRCLLPQFPRRNFPDPGRHRRSQSRVAEIHLERH